MSYPASILVVEDDRLNRQVAVRLLRSKGHDVTSIASATDCIETVMRLKPSIVLLDYMLPHISGYDLCRQIKSTSPIRDTIVVMISSYQKSSEAQTNSLEAGADAYIVRPLQNREFLARIEAMVRLRHIQDVAMHHARQQAALAAFSHALQNVERHDELFFRTGTAVVSVLKVDHVIIVEGSNVPGTSPGSILYASCSEKGTWKECVLSWLSETDLVHVAEAGVVSALKLPPRVLAQLYPDTDCCASSWWVPIHSSAGFLGGILVVWGDAHASPCELCPSAEESATSMCTTCPTFLKSVAATAGITITRIIQQERLAASERRFRTLSEASPAGIAHLDARGRYTYTNETWSELTRLSADSVAGRHWLRSLPIVDKRAVIASWQQSDSSSTFRVDVCLRPKKRTSVWIHIQLAADMRGDKRVGYICTFTDMTDRKEAELALDEERKRLDVTLRSIGDGVITTDAEGRIHMINKVAEDLTGWPAAEAIDRPLDVVCRIVREDSREPADHAVRPGAELEVNSVLVGRDGSEKIVTTGAAPIRDTGGSVIGAVIIIRDITRRCLLERRTQQSQRLDSLAVFAGGIAHDFNNYLMAIISNVALAKTTSNGNNAMERYLDRIETACEDTHQLSQQLLALSDGDEIFRKIVALQPLLQSAGTFSAHGTNCRVEARATPDLWCAHADPAQIRQVIHNLVLNAIHAMPGGGNVEMSATNRIVKTDNLQGLAAGNYVEITVSDHGSGIAAEHRDRIFDPFFTTRHNGAGLGLTVVFSIVRKHLGHICCTSETGVGSTFHVYIPAAADSGAIACDHTKSEIEL